MSQRQSGTQALYCTPSDDSKLDRRHCMYAVGSMLSGDSKAVATAGVGLFVFVRSTRMWLNAMQTVGQVGFCYGTSHPEAVVDFAATYAAREARRGEENPEADKTTHFWDRYDSRRGRHQYECRISHKYKDTTNPRLVHSSYYYHQTQTFAMASSVVKILSHLAVLCSVLPHVSGEQHADQLAERDTSLQPRGFLDSCVDWGGTVMNEKYKMAAICRTTTGDWTWSVLDLNHCMVNRDGSLMAQDDGHFFLRRSLTQNDDSDERHVDHGIDLNLVVGNDNGTLFCGRQAYKGLVYSQDQISWSDLGAIKVSE
ncbi:hypothetical protein BDP81DRAFT_451428 [Colletotrichum phormii]|uniref:Cyanovirin-N domain-containing protein n=1 Tax=Colletotrichum phormii TaxID=359342 RepID=A0AAJ0ECN1_9PEZI|nr:uncharacterized protein BDP81DRAFT_451428 [Colletotrichum phormii]KAK1634957.1 hypothetical protein BDP81DRAFT_451428 [Colletotrichum phormii]